MIIPNAKKTTLKNGLTVLYEDIPVMRSVSIGILVGAGSGNETAKESGISHFIEHMLFKGTKKRSAFDIAHTLDSVGGKINAYTGKEYTVYYAVVLDRHIETALELIHEERRKRLAVHIVRDDDELALPRLCHLLKKRQYLFDARDLLVCY